MDEAVVIDTKDVRTAPRVQQNTNEYSWRRAAGLLHVSLLKKTYRDYRYGFEWGRQKVG